MMLWHRGYQKDDTMMGAVHTKIKGSASDPDNLNPVLAAQSWDADDLVRYYTDGFFMPTRIQTTRQSQGKCSLGAKSHSKKLKGVWTEKCTQGGDQCKDGVHTFHGVQTGTCISDGRDISNVSGGEELGLIGVCRGGALDGSGCFGDDDVTTCAEGGGVCKGSFCELSTWCPVEGANPNATQEVELDGWENFSVFARIDTIFPQFDKQHNNLHQSDGQVCSVAHDYAWSVPACRILSLAPRACSGRICG